ncbi:MDS1 and EVI1 complex locus protein EVI1-A-like [Anthonomus grandis grandis]|uniref:MDS1 and EVI1 complex locus protein EVI1-A-like n=1 Tax=Anthonomus grandis grandis TaxID=2921223 RepID=UPI0021665256|nr:MDS1 and EVI1 complex locus protein EVI1-A-like [Anthonomus grandis grandis]
MKSPQSKHVRLLQEKHQENIESMLKNLFRDETLSDITLHCKDGVVKAHRVILAASSSYFRKLFEEHPENQVAFLIHGVSAKQIKCLVELMYRGSTQIPSEMTTKICNIAEEFGVKGVVDENEKLLNSSGIDTRFKGQKRVTVDFENELTSQTKRQQRRLSSCSDKSSKKSPSDENPMNPLESLGLISTHIKEEPQDQTPVVANAALSNSEIALLSPEMRRRHNWAMKQRKYKCTLCPASFKRASHLTRHQLVHTGERPYACNQCDKAFSRHDKLKHHIRKAHDIPYMEDMIDRESEHELYSIGQVKLNSPSFEPSAVITREDLLAEMRLQEAPKPLASIPEIPKVSSIVKEISTEILPLKVNAMSSLNKDKEAVSSISTLISQKKGRGRPRKYPPVLKPLIKRPRGRPRLNSSISRLQNRSADSKSNDGYTDAPIENINEYLATSIHQEDSESTENESQFDSNSNSNIDPAHFVEPIIALNLDQNQGSSSSISKVNTKSQTTEERLAETRNYDEPPQTTAGSFLKNIGLLETNSVSKMNIGECTISVSSSTVVGNSTTTLQKEM